MMRLITAFFISIIAAGPANAQSLKYRTDRVATVPFQKPELNAQTTAEPGQVVLASGEILPGITVTVPASARVMGQTATVPAGPYRLVARSDVGSFFRPDSPMTLQALGLATTWQDGGVYLPDDRTAPAHVYYRSEVGLLFHGPLPGLEWRDAEASSLSGGFRRELIYGGVSKGVVALTYREFVDDMARPAFTQALTYDLSDGDQIAYRGARLIVITANNVGLTYIVTKPLDPGMR